MRLISATSLLALISFGAAPAISLAAETFSSPTEHFSLTLPASVIAMTPAELTRANLAAAARGGTPLLYEAGYLPPAPTKPSLPLVLIRYVPGQVSLESFAKNYADRLSQLSPPPTPGQAPAGVANSAAQTQPTTAPALRVEATEALVESELRRTTADGVLVRREIVRLGRDGVAVVDYSGTITQADQDLRPLLASFQFDHDYRYAAPRLMVLSTSSPHSSRRAIAATLLVTAALLFLAVTLMIFVRARRRDAA